MGSRPKSGAKRKGISQDVLEAAQTIARIKGEDLDELESKFFSDYVNKNYHLMTEMVVQILDKKKESQDA